MQLFNTGASAPAPPKRRLTNIKLYDTIEYMTKYKVQVTEALSRIIEVEAKSEEEAIAEIERRYQEEEIVLDSNDGCGVEVDIVVD